MNSAQFSRSDWLVILKRIARPVLCAMADDRLGADIPREIGAGGEDRPDFAPQEAICRLLSGLSPWLELTDAPDAEQALQQQYRTLALRALEVGFDPQAADYLDFSQHEQGLVEAAILAQAFLRAPRTLWGALSDTTKAAVIANMKVARRHQPFYNNHLLFAAMIETFLWMIGEEWDRMRVDYALRSHDEWYAGDGVYRDGPEFHYDYYQSFVIHPFLLTIGERLQDEREYDDWRDMVSKMIVRARRGTVQQALSIAPDGSFPAIGRSLTYRCGAFHLLAFMSLREELPPGLSPGSIRCALSAVIDRCMNAPGTFDNQGWLTLGLSGHQPGMADFYTNTGSLYLCSEAFLPLGLPASSQFWQALAEPIPWQQAWNDPHAQKDSYLERVAERYGGNGW